MPLDFTDPYQEAAARGYGNSTWDLFRPNPGWREDLNKQLWAGAQIENQPSPGGYIEPRSPFGRAMESIGILSPQEPKEFTDYQKLTIQQGGVAKLIQDMKLDAARMGLQQGRLDLAQDYMTDEGTAPPQEFLEGMPDIGAGIGKRLGEREQNRQLKMRKDVASTNYQNALTELMGQKSALGGTGTGGGGGYSDTYKRMLEVGRVQNLNTVKSNLDEAKKAYANAIQAPNMNMKMKYLEQAAAWQRRARQAAAALNYDSAMQLAATGEPINPDREVFGGPLPPAEDKRILGPQNLQGIDAYLNQLEGGGIGPARDSTPGQTQGPSPFITPSPSPFPVR